MKRLDIVLVENGFFSTREKARKAIVSGMVKVNGAVATKPALLVDEQSKIEAAEFEFVSRGALKLVRAIEFFGLNLQGCVVLDVGASTGGFTDVALKFGAKKVYAVDTGTGQLAEKLRNDPRVVNLEKTNFLTLEKSKFFDANFVCMDVSFVSLTKFTEKLWKDFGETNVKIVALIKPQFECGLSYARKHKGVVRDEKVRKKAVRDVTFAFEQQGFCCLGVTDSPIKGGDGNQEFLACFVASGK